MVFTCDGEIFTDLTLDTSNNALLATFEAADTWYDAAAAITISIYGNEVKEDIDSLCELIPADDGDDVTQCGAAGSVTLDLTSIVTDSEVPDGTPWAIVSTALAASTIEIEVMQNDEVVERCTKEGVDSYTRGYHMAPIPAPAKTAGYAIGAVALVGLALYAVKRRNRASSKTGADEKLVEGQLA